MPLLSRAAGSAVRANRHAACKLGVCGRKLAIYGCRLKFLKWTHMTHMTHTTELRTWDLGGSSETDPHDPPISFTTPDQNSHYVKTYRGHRAM